METIAAISTAIGNGGIGIIRMSGKECFKILEKIFRPKNNNFDDIKGYSIKFGYIVDSETDEIIDEVLVSFFKSPKSYTTEDMCEINSHGGMIVQKLILEQCLKNGANIAGPGEFTKRAFLNGRIDLSQAESVIDLINSKTEKEAKASIAGLEGSLSRKIQEIRSDLLDIMSDIEATIDYPEYDIEEVTNNRAIKELTNILEKLVTLEKSFETGRILKEGIKTIIIGKPNAGKSSLLNLILDEERAIVSDIAGTTRDTIEEYINLKGIPIKLIDTAGIRETSDKIEEIGVNKSISLVNNADLIISIFDNSKELEKEDYKILELIKNKNSIIVLNKNDLGKHVLDKKEEILNLQIPIVKMSAKLGDGTQDLYNNINNMFNIGDIELDDSMVITNVRHKNQIKKAEYNIKQAIDTIKQDLPIDIIGIYIKESLNDLGTITGQNVSEDIINEIFSKFCLGK
ncbi:MAG TPA: tRNA uridine-5-carboxymethylaminomethyl(34) synthesis GTPase MnmE [Clostridiales bacterium]|nr:tRNA uridine-5-carboxymethylaminomethyl(34) synthesis GTPase MnmE [Clostridiales bacterium]